MSNDVNEWRQELAAEAKAAVAATPPAAGFTISTAQGRLKVRGEEVPGSKAAFIVLGFAHENQFFDSDYDSKNPAPPCCYAFSTTGDKKAMRPHPESTAKQAPQCHGCPNLEWGSARVGKGKGCKEVVRLALIPATLEPDEISAAEIGYLKVPVMSVKHWSSYVTQLAGKLQIPPFAAITEIKITPDNQVTVFFALNEPIEDGAVITAIMAKRKEVNLERPYEARATTPAPAPKTRSALQRRL